ncbi:MAG TPA: TonB-dependent receptor [Rudaea sp.]
MSQKPLFTLSTLSLCVGLALSAAARAQSAQWQPPVEVTASRVTETVDASLADVSVISRADIEKSHAPDLIDLLRLQAGVDIARTGGAGEQTSVFVRGTNSNHVLVLIDGVRVASANTGAFAFENLPLDAVERIEIVRGPRASYWGSDAIGGVIQVFTRRLDSAHVAASYGSYGSADGSIGYGAQGDAGGFSVQLGGRHVDGFSAANAAAGPYVYNPDDNPFQNHSGVANANYRFGSQTLSASAFRSVGTQSFDNGVPGPAFSHTLDQAIGVNLEGALTDAWSHRLSVATSRENIETPAFLDAYRSTREQVSWTNDVALSPTQHLIAGVDYAHDHGVSIDDSGFGAPYDITRDNDGVFAGWRAQDGALDGEVSGRYDHYDGFGGAFSGSLAGGWKLADNLRLSASYGTAFRAPNLNELYSPGYGGLFAGNPNLDPERSHTAEVGLTWRVDAANEVTARGFSTRVHDLIDFSGGTTLSAINIDRAAIDGFELSHDLHAGEWSMSNRYTWQNPRDEDSGAQLLRRPKNKFSSLLERSLGDRASGGVELAYSGRRDDTGGVTLPSYAIVNLRASYALSPSWRIGARVENLFDRDYELVHGYNTPGRSGYLDLVWEPR